MSPIPRALPWAVASLAVALASIFDLIPEAQAQTLIIVIPALMVATIVRTPCAPRQRNV